MKNNYNNYEKGARKATQDYMYYSKILKEPFSSVEELKEAEEAYYAKLKAKEDKAAQKKADAKTVEEAFVALNAARKAYKEDLTALANDYSESLHSIKRAFEAAQAEIKARLATAEEAYSAALKAFTEKYPEGYHLTLKDGDFETTISSTVASNKDTKLKDAADLYRWFFNNL